MHLGAGIAFNLARRTHLDFRVPGLVVGEARQPVIVDCAELLVSTVGDWIASR